MIIQMSKRKYRLNQRAVQQQKTRDRILEAIIALHEEIGPAATTVSAIAERAGVQRLTVYRHFADERAMLDACTTTWLGRNPPPNPKEITAEGEELLTVTVLLELYRYYEKTAGMWTSAYRDKEQVPALADAMTGFEDYLEMVKSHLLNAWSPLRSKRLRASIGHALRFSTWQSLEAQKLSAREMSSLVGSWIRTAAR